jgi:hypothetical protein
MPAYLKVTILATQSHYSEFFLLCCIVRYVTLYVQPYLNSHLQACHHIQYLYTESRLEHMFNI